MKHLLASLLLSLSLTTSMVQATEVNRVEDEITIELQQDSIEDLMDYYNYNFGMVPTRFRHTARFTIINNTDEEIRYVNSYIMGNYYSVNHFCFKALKPRESCMAEIVFWPMQKGFYGGMFVMDFARYKTVRINLQGQAM